MLFAERGEGFLLGVAGDLGIGVEEEEDDDDDDDDDDEEEDFFLGVVGIWGWEAETCLRSSKNWES